MGTTKTGNAINAAIVSVLRDSKKKSGKTYDQIIADTGIPERTLKRLFADEHSLDTDEITAIAASVGINDLIVITLAMGLIKEGDGI